MTGPSTTIILSGWLDHAIAIGFVVPMLLSGAMVGLTVWWVLAKMLYRLPPCVAVRRWWRRFRPGHWAR